MTAAEPNVRVGTYLTDGTLLVQVLALRTDGWEVENSADPAREFVIVTGEQKKWRRVDPDADAA